MKPNALPLILGAGLALLVMSLLVASSDQKDSDRALASLIEAKDRQVAGAFELGVAYGAIRIKPGQTLAELHKEINAEVKRGTKGEWTRYLP